MLIPLLHLARKYKLNVRGIVHVGAHECEEKDVYDKIGVNDVVWIEGNSVIYEKMRKKYPNEKIYNALISDSDNQVVDFIITNNGQSSSILELEEHKIQHPSVREIERRQMPTKTLKTLFNEEHLDFANYNFLNCDVQGAELLVLKGMGDELARFDHLYLEVNTRHLYKDCALLPEILEYVGRFGFKQIELKMTPHYWGDIFMSKVVEPFQDVQLPTPDSLYGTWKLDDEYNMTIVSKPDGKFAIVRNHLGTTEWTPAEIRWDQGTFCWSVLSQEQHTTDCIFCFVPTIPDEIMESVNGVSNLFVRNAFK